MALAQSSFPLQQLRSESHIYIGLVLVCTDHLRLLLWYYSKS